LAAGLSLAGFRAISQASAGDARAEKGEWAAVFDWPNVPIHVHVLANGKVLFWGRREKNQGLDPHDCKPRLWDPAKATDPFSFTANEPGFNLFCSGHTFLADGRLLVVGGHIMDSHGEKKATIYDPATNKWAGIEDMNKGRWYPTAVTLADGGVLVSSGQIQGNQGNNKVQQVLDPGKDKWRGIVEHKTIPLYPRMHLAPDGRVFLAGHLQTTQLLETRDPSKWQVVGKSKGQQREDGCSVLYDAGKVLIVGGGRPPQKTAEVIDLTQGTPAWKDAQSMAFARRHHNATLLPDGTVLVTGGTRGDGGPHPFNDLSKPVKEPELWDPATDKWITLAPEKESRLYHSTAVLLPDARVLSAGGGEYRLDNGHENAAKDSLRNGQIFSPPYLFRGKRPEISSAPESVKHGDTFEVGTSEPDKVGYVNWIRLPSVTHSLNMNQRFNFLKFTTGDAKLKVTAPADGKACPPGHYMLFVLNKDKVPSVAKIIRID